jgi:tRNA dimethylallyltransferase
MTSRLSDLPPSDPAVRAALDAEIAAHGIEQLHSELARVDAETAARLKPTDTQRIQRAMEIYRISGQPMSTLINKPTAPLPAFGHPLPQAGEGLGEREVDSFPFRIIPIALIPSDRAQLHARIATRFKTMLEQGLVTELHMLREKYPLHPNMTSMRCVGYRQAWQFMEGEINDVQLLETGIIATRQLAKRQLTWLRSMPENIELDCLAPNLERMVLDALTAKI